MPAKEAAKGKEKKPEMFVKKSIGIALLSPDRKRVLLIKKRYTYEYDAFLHGRYDINAPGATERMTHLFQGMTLEEKLIIKTRNFSFMWLHKHLYLGTPPSGFYSRGLAKFGMSFGVGMGDEAWAWLLKIIGGTSCATSTIYEVPKGRKSEKNEPNIITAMREVEEETSIGPNDYHLIPEVKRMTMKVEDGVRYLAVYYVAVVKDRVTPLINITNPSQCFEAAEMGWYTPEEMKKIRVQAPLIKVCTEVISAVKQVGRRERGKKPLEAFQGCVRGDRP